MDQKKKKKIFYFVWGRLAQETKDLIFVAVCNFFIVGTLVAFFFLALK